jgi:hypothetical protein
MNRRDKRKLAELNRACTLTLITVQANAWNRFGTRYEREGRWWRSSAI